MRSRAHQVQVSVSIRKPKGVKITREFLNSALHYRASTGENPPGVEVKVIIWSVNGKEKHYETDSDITAALNDLFKTGWKVDVRQMGKGERTVQSKDDTD